MNDREQLKEEVLRNIVKELSRLGTCNRSKVGALIVKDGRILSTGYNGSPPGEAHCTDVGCLMVGGHCVRTTHAESNAIAFAAQHGIAIKGAKIYVHGWITSGTLGLCPSCEKLAKSAGIVETVTVPIGDKPNLVVCTHDPNTCNVAFCEHPRCNQPTECLDQHGHQDI